MATAYYSSLTLHHNSRTRGSRSRSYKVGLRTFLFWFLVLLAMLHVAHYIDVYNLQNLILQASIFHYLRLFPILFPDCSICICLSFLPVITSFIEGIILKNNVLQKRMGLRTLL